LSPPRCRHAGGLWAAATAPSVSTGEETVHLPCPLLLPLLTPASAPSLVRSCVPSLLCMCVCEHADVWGPLLHDADAGPDRGAADAHEAEPRAEVPLLAASLYGSPCVH
jgi:hypothetical protein